MPAPSFVHLRLHSEFSIVDGIVRLDEAVAKAAAEGMPALGLTDLGNVFALVKFYQAARARGVKPVIGCDAWVESRREAPQRILLLCQNHDGYLRLARLLTRGFRDKGGRAELRKSWFREEGTEGLIALSGGKWGEVGNALSAGNFEQAKAAAVEWGQLFPNRFYLELQRGRDQNSEMLVRRSVQLASSLALPVVATHPVQFLDEDDFKAHETRVCIASGYLLNDSRRPRNFTREDYFKSAREMEALFADLPAALENTVEIAKRCSLELELGINRLPACPTPDGVGVDAYLRSQAEAGLAQRLPRLIADQRQATTYAQRLQFELSMITRMGYSGYFLIVADFINWAKKNGVPVGPGRGSGAGSLVAYSLGITELDPLRYDLLFERFLNPERVSMPDFDIDFCQDGRDRVIDYVKQTYGADSVSQIATFGTMAARAVVRDVGRVLGLPYNFVDQLAKLIPMELGMTLKKAREREPLLNERASKEEEVGELLSLAERLEGITRNVGMHAGGVLIAPGRLFDFCPLYRAEGSAHFMSQFDKDDVERIGLVKFDFLGLTTLTILDWAVKYVRIQADSRILHPESFDLENIPLDDLATFAIFASGNTTAIFQSESKSARDLERRLKPDTFEDVIALMALNRPGPLQSGMVEDFIRRKHGRERAEYFHPSLEPVLKPTYGVIVYQEQVMQVAQILAGYSLGSADLLRRAMGKKKPEEMAKHRSIFVEGAAARGVDLRQAEHLFDLMEKFAEYGFNKSHSAAYALIAYQTAYLKAHYPAAFMAATLSAEMHDSDKVRLFHDDCIANGLAILPPDINLSEYRFVPVSEREIRYGLGAIKGTGESAIAEIVAAREAGRPFLDLFDFCRRVDKRVVNRRAVEAFIRAGAFDSLNDDRASLLASVGLSLDAAEQASAGLLQNSLFGEASPLPQVALKQAPRWSDAQRLQNEKAALGLYLSGHPFHGYRAELAALVSIRLADLNGQAQSALLAGIVANLRTQHSRRGRMAILTLDDATARVEVTVFTELYDAHRGWLKEDQLVLVEGRVSQDDYTGGVKVTADKLYDLAAARNAYARRLRLDLNGDANAQKLVATLKPFRRGPCPVSVTYHNGVAACDLELGEEWRVSLREELLQALKDWLPRVEIEYR